MSKNKKKTKTSIVIGNNIKNFRNIKGLTQKELGKKIGKALTTVQQYEYGEVTPPIETLEKITKALDVHIINLLGLEKEHKSIAKLTVDTKVNMTELEIAKAKLDQIKVLINEINNMEIKLDVEANVRR
jgi:transcriptional regulator with XRE-family HTH domain